LLRDNLFFHGVAADTQPQFRDFRAGDVLHSEADISKAGRLLGYTPTHRLEKGISIAIPWYVTQKITSVDKLL